MSNCDEEISALICHLLLKQRHYLGWGGGSYSNTFSQRFLYEPMTPELIDETKMWVRDFLTERLGNVIAVADVQIEEESRFLVTIEYVLRQSDRHEVICVEIAP